MRRISERPPAACQVCGGAIPLTRRSGSGRLAKYCSVRCNASVHGPKWKSRNPEHTKATRDKSNAKRDLAYFHATYGTTLPKHPLNMTKNPFRHAVALGYRSGLEVRVAKELDATGIAYTYEKHKLRYVKPERSSTYTPDYVLANGIIVETKGRFTTEDRQKHQLVKAQHPEAEIRFVFSRSAATISKASKTTYADWCIKNGFTFADKSIPDSWLREAPRPLPTFVN